MRVRGVEEEESMTGERGTLLSSMGFQSGVLKAARSWCVIWRRVAEELGIPYLEGEQEAVEGLDVTKALERLGGRGVDGVYFHVPTLTLVLVVGEERIGIRSTVLALGKGELLGALRSRR